MYLDSLKSEGDAGRSGELRLTVCQDVGESHTPAGEESSATMSGVDERLGVVSGWGDRAMTYG